MTTFGTFGLALKIGHGATAPAAIAALILGRILLDEWTFAASLAVMAVASLYYELISAWFLVTNLKYRAISPRAASPLSRYCVRQRSHRTRLGDANTSVRYGFRMRIHHAGLRGKSVSHAKRRRETGVRPLLRFAFASQAGAMSQYLNNRLDILYLATFGTRANLGVYAVGASIGQATLFLGSAGIIRGVLGRHAKFDWSGVALIALAAGVLWGVCPVAVHSPSVMASRMRSMLHAFC